MAKTLFDKIWDKYVVEQMPGGPAVLFIAHHFIHEVTSPQAFKMVEEQGLKVFMPNRTTATADHNIPTENQHLPIGDKLSAEQVAQLRVNCNKHQIRLFDIGDVNNGVVHIIGPELGITQPGMTIVCGDSHTSTHGAFGTIAFGIGTSEVANVFATQCILQYKPKLMRITINGTLKSEVYAKDVILYIITQLTTNGGAGYFIEFAGEAVRKMSMEARMTLCNMSIELGAKGGLIAPDEVTFAYLKDRPLISDVEYSTKLPEWEKLYSDADAFFDKEIAIDASTISPMITYGTNPGMAIPVNAMIPSHKNDTGLKASLKYMGFESGERLAGKKIDYVFIGSCTNARIEDMRVAASVVKGQKKATHTEVWIVPGSRRVAEQAKEEGLMTIFEDAGIKMREPGCSACLAMNDDKIPAEKYCVSTSNRNFEGRQGERSRTLLASPYIAALVAIQGVIPDLN